MGTWTTQGRSEQGRKKRQQILDHMHKLGEPCDAGALMILLKETARRTMVARLQRMHELEELSRETRLINARYVHFYAPLVEVTSPKFEASAWALKAMGEQPDDEALVPAKLTVKGPWHTVNRCNDSKLAIPNQGGQGSVGPRMGTKLEAVW